MKRINYIEINGEKIKVEEAVFAYCTCPSKSGIDLEKVPSTPDEGGINHTCDLCGSYVVWTNNVEITNNARR